MEKILFATRALADEYANTRYQGCYLREIPATIDNFNNDDSLQGLGPRDGECPAYDIEDNDGNTLAILAWWEEGSEYIIRLNGEPVKTVTCWVKATEAMEELAKWEEEDAVIDCVIDGDEIVNFKDL